MRLAGKAESSTPAGLPGWGRRPFRSVLRLSRETFNDSPTIDFRASSSKCPSLMWHAHLARESTGETPVPPSKYDTTFFATGLQFRVGAKANHCVSFFRYCLQPTAYCLLLSARCSPLTALVERRREIL